MLDFQDMLVILGKYTKISNFIKTRVNGEVTTKLMIKVNGEATTKLIILLSSTILKGLTINCLNV